MVTRKNYLAILLLALLMIVPHIVLYSHLKENYFPVIVDNKLEDGTVFKNYDELQYYSYINEMSDKGKYILGETAIYENKGKPSMYFSQTIPYLIAGKIKALIPNHFWFTIISVLLFSFIYFMVIYHMMLFLTKNKSLSLLSVPIISSPFIFAKPNPLKIFEQLLHLRGGYEFLGSPISMRIAFGMSLFFLFILFFLKSYLKEGYTKKDFGYLLLSSVCIGLLFYSYFFYWSYIYGALGVLIIIDFFRKRWDNVKKIITLKVISSVFFIPYGVLWLKNFVAGGYLDYVAKLGAVSRSIDWYFTSFYLLFLIFFIVVYKYTGSNNKNKFYFLISFIIGTIVLLNQHMISRFSVYRYYYASVGFFMILVMVFVSIDYVVKRYSLKLDKLFYFSFILILIFFAANQYLNPYTLMDHHKIDNGHLKSLDWLNENAMPEEVVATSSIRNIQLIPAYTKLNVLTTFSPVTSIPNSELLERYYVTFKLFNVSNQYMWAWLNMDPKHPESANNRLFDHTYSYDYGDIPFEIKLKIFNEYKNYDINNHTKFRINYIYYSDLESNLSKLDPNLLNSLNFIEVYNKEGVIIYKNDRHRT